MNPEDTLENLAQWLKAAPADYTRSARIVVRRGEWVVTLAHGPEVHVSVGVLLGATVDAALTEWTAVHS